MKAFKRTISALLLTAGLLSLAACGADSKDPQDTASAQESAIATEISDVNGHKVSLAPGARVACGYSSFAQCWLLSGGSLVGVTQDAVEERGLDVPGDVGIIGTVKSIDLERLVALEPDYVILSADLTAHNELKESLDALDIGYGFFRVDTFDDYKAMMEQFCAVNGRADLYTQNVLETEERIQAVKDKIPAAQGQSVLLIRAFSTGMKAKTDDNLAGQILKEYGLENIADKYPSLLEDLSMEQIILEDPQYIFVITMGDEQGAMDYLKANVDSDPAWSSLSAVKEGRYIILPQELFHYKPNERWDESYEYLAKIIYPQLFE